MAVVEQKFDDCENHGLKHAWKIFELKKINWCGTSTGGITSTSIKPEEVPMPEPFPHINQEVTHVRRCQNCVCIEEFVVSESEKWVRK
jgi:hypothetical protein